MSHYTAYLRIVIYCAILSVSLFAARFSEAIFAAEPLSLKPLPGGCGHVTPPDTPQPCCISGFVYGDGQALFHARLFITTADGKSVQTGTLTRSGDETRPYYSLDLSSDPLRVSAGEAITLTARLGDHEHSMRYIVQSGGQQVDFVFPTRQQPDYLFERTITSTLNLSNLRAVAYDSQNQLYALDSYSSQISVFDSSGNILRTWGSAGSQPGQLKQPEGLAIGPDNNVYITDTQNHRIQVFASTGSFMRGWGSLGSAAGQFNSPKAIAIAPDGTIYVADTDNNRIQKFSSNGIWLASWGSQGSGPGQLDGPAGIAINPSGNIYVADQFNNRIHKLRSDGVVLTSWGSYGTAAAQFFEPRGIAVDSKGRVFVADSGNDRIQVFSDSGSWLASWGADGIVDGLFGMIYGIALKSDGYIAVADSLNEHIAIFRPMLETRPIATINHIKSLDIIGNDTLVAIGLGTDSDTNEPISTYQWLSDRQGILGETANLSYPAFKLLQGTHELSFMVRDAQGHWSAPVQTQIFVESGGYRLFLPALGK